MEILFASDLDNTLIYSYKKIQGPSVLVETREGKALSYMTETAFALLQEAVQKCIFAPITTRSLEQYRRISLLRQGVPRYAVTSNGGHLLVDGEIDESWHTETLRMIAESMPELAKAEGILLADPDRSFDVRLIDDVFLFTKTNHVEASCERLAKVLDAGLVELDTNGEKLYVLPKKLHKGMALERLKERLHAPYTIAAGDSRFDLPMLLAADLAVLPRAAFVEGAAMKECRLYDGGLLGFGDMLLSELFLRIQKLKV